jgi:putative flippase GtrA
MAEARDTRRRDGLSTSSPALPGQAFRFGAVGGVGFLVDAGVLTALHQLLDVEPIGARAVSFTLAVTATWALNRIFTFTARPGRRRSSEWLRYTTVNGIGALMNLGIFVVLVAYYPLMSAHPLLPLAVAAGPAMIFNFFASRRLAFLH